MLIGVGTDAEERKELMFTVTRDPAGTATTSSGTATALPVSDDAWNASVVLAARAPGFWSVRYSTKPGRTVPSAKRNVFFVMIRRPPTSTPFPSTPLFRSAEK